MHKNAIHKNAIHKAAERTLEKAFKQAFHTAACTTALVSALVGASAQAQVTEDCILEGTVDMRKAEHLGQPVYVRFEEARSGSEGPCSMSRPGSKSRRVQFVSSPDVRRLETVSHGARVHYRYTERDGQPGTWELIKVSQ
jgi:hypothetical protein